MGKRAMSATVIGRRKTHGHAANYRPSPTYGCWSGMISRCSDAASCSYSQYGGRGITVCERWKKFENFLADMGEKPGGKSLDRFPGNNGNYELSNCRWATRLEQQNNMRSNRLITHNGETHTVAEWARIKGMRYTTLLGRFQHGWGIQEALNRDIATSRRPQ